MAVHLFTSWCSFSIGEAFAALSRAKKRVAMAVVDTMVKVVWTFRWGLGSGGKGDVEGRSKCPSQVTRIFL